MDDHRFGEAVLDDLTPLHRELRHAIPDVYKGFAELHRASLGPGALDVKTKELMAWPLLWSSTVMAASLHTREAPRSPVLPGKKPQKPSGSQF